MEEEVRSRGCHTIAVARWQIVYLPIDDNRGVVRTIRVWNCRVDIAFDGSFPWCTMAHSAGAGSTADA